MREKLTSGPSDGKSNYCRIIAKTMSATYSAAKITPSVLVIVLAVREKTNASALRMSRIAKSQTEAKLTETG